MGEMKDKHSNLNGIFIRHYHMLADCYTVIGIRVQAKCNLKGISSSTLSKRLLERDNCQN